MVSSTNWVLLSYHIPREPSTPRIAVWRRLKRLGVAQLSDGLVALPFDAANQEALEWVAAAVEDADGEATIWIATPTARRFGEELATQLAEERADEYRELMERVADVDEQTTERSRRALRSALRRIERRDHFPPPERQLARDAIEQLDQRTGERT